MKTNKTAKSMAFMKMKVAHPHLTTAIEELVTAISEAEQGEILYLFGPTGAGKTTLAKSVKAKLNKELKAELGNHRSIVPVILNEAAFPDSKQFSWIEYYRRALKKLNEPLIEKKIADIRCSVHADKLSDEEIIPEVPVVGRVPAGHALRMSFENALRLRKTRVLIIDEAQHIGKGLSPVGIKNQLEYLKSLANLTETIIVLIGTYELLGFINLSGQLARRSNDIHMPRYFYNTVEERQEYFNIVGSFINKLPIPHTLDLISLMDKFYIKSAGCIGILSTWIKKAVKMATRTVNPVLTEVHIEKQALSYSKLMIITEELVEGEAMLVEDPEAEEKIMARLGLLPTEPKPVSSNPAPLAKTPKRKKKVGQRNPHRDKVGVHPVTGM